MDEKKNGYGNDKYLCIRSRSKCPGYSEKRR